MSVSIDLRVLAKKLENNSEELLIKAESKGILPKVAQAIAAASTLLEEVANDMDSSGDFSMEPEQLDEIAALASAFSESGDPLLQKQASVLDDFLVSIALSREASEKATQVKEDTINEMRAERRKAKVDELYKDPKKALNERNRVNEQVKAVKQMPKKYRVMEAPLQTRYSPDMPGSMMVRITDGVYQDITTGKIYDYEKGYTTDKGNEVPGGSVANQTAQFGDHNHQSTSLFQTRESMMGRWSEANEDSIKKYAYDDMSFVLRATRDLAPAMLRVAIDIAMNHGLSAEMVGEVLASDADVDDSFDKTGDDPIEIDQNEYERYRKIFNLMLDTGNEQTAQEVIDNFLENLKSQSGAENNKYIARLEEEFGESALPVLLSDITKDTKIPNRSKDLSKTDLGNYLPEDTDDEFEEVNPEELEEFTPTNIKEINKSFASLESLAGLLKKKAFNPNLLKVKKEEYDLIEKKKIEEEAAKQKTLQDVKQELKVKPEVEDKYTKSSPLPSKPIPAPRANRITDDFTLELIDPPTPDFVSKIQEVDGEPQDEAGLYWIFPSLSNEDVISFAKENGIDIPNKYKTPAEIVKGPINRVIREELVPYLEQRQYPGPGENISQEAKYLDLVNFLKQHGATNILENLGKAKRQDILDMLKKQFQKGKAPSIKKEVIPSKIKTPAGGGLEWDEFEESYQKAADAANALIETNAVQKSDFKDLVNKLMEADGVVGAFRTTTVKAKGSGRGKIISWYMYSKEHKNVEQSFNAMREAYEEEEKQAPGTITPVTNPKLWGNKFETDIEPFMDPAQNNALNESMKAPMADGKVLVGFLDKPANTKATWMQVYYKQKENTLTAVFPKSLKSFYCKTLQEGTTIRDAIHASEIQLVAEGKFDKDMSVDSLIERGFVKAENNIETYDNPSEELPAGTVLFVKK